MTKKPTLKLSSKGFPQPQKVNCFQCKKSFCVKFVIPRQAYSQKNSWTYWTGEPTKQQICDACLRELYYNKPRYWTTVKDLKKRNILKNYIHHNFI